MSDTNKQLNQVSAVRCHGGMIETYEHQSQVNNCTMRFAIYIPKQATFKPCHTLYWLSGLTCTEENFIAKAGALQFAAKHGIIIVAPDTSPRGENVPDDPDGAWDFGHGAGFYVDATQSPWAEHYNMYSYIVKELPTLVEKHFNVSDKKSIFGHSMGGHGALTIALKNPGLYKSASAFAPICAPSEVPWGHKAFSNYLGNYRGDWLDYDTCNLLAKQDMPFEAKVPILVSQGSSDNFLQQQLKPELLEQAGKDNKHPLSVEYHEGYDHSYYFISSFIEQHIEFHLMFLNQKS